MFRRSLFLTLIISLLLTALQPLVAQAATSRTVKGTVACQYGQTVSGVWVSSSNGGSRWASITRRSGAPWLADYTASITTSASSTSIRLDIGCGTTSTGAWWSNNSTSAVTVSGSTTRSAVCKEASGSRQVRCKWWGATVLVGMPFKGVFDKNSVAHPRYHPTTGDWSVDLYQAPGVDNRLRLYAPMGRTLTVRTNAGNRSCTGSCTVGQNAWTDVYLSGTKIGYVKYGHLTGVPSSTTSVGAYLGDLKLWNYHPEYWQVSRSADVHVHFTAYNQTGYSCYWPRNSGSTYNEGRLIGKIGVTNATGQKQACN
jgi:hypothetical protein